MLGVWPRLACFSVIPASDYLKPVKSRLLLKHLKSNLSLIHGLSLVRPLFSALCFTDKISLEENISNIVFAIILSI